MTFDLHSIHCATCRRPMQKLGAAVAEDYLTWGESLEEAAGAASYDVWLCSECGSTTRKRHLRVASGVTVCPLCGYRTLRRTSHVVREADGDQPGEGRDETYCAHCEYFEAETYELSDKPEPQGHLATVSSLLTLLFAGDVTSAYDLLRKLVDHLKR